MWWDFQICISVPLTKKYLYIIIVGHNDNILVLSLDFNEGFKLLFVRPSQKTILQ